MDNNINNSKRIAKNTLVLYLRMILLMLISLYTSRVVLNELGVEDYGIYNVVGGFVAMFYIVSGSLASAISRFLTFELGKEDKSQLKKIFSASITIQLLLSAIVVLLTETIGLWYINNIMVVPESRISAANVLFQFSILSFVLNLISIPYNAAIIAHEKMSAFAWIGLFQGIAYLLIAMSIPYAPFDSLIYYGLMILLVSIIQRIIYQVYCKRKFEECHYVFSYDKVLFKQMFSFAGWNFIGSSASILRDQGGNMLINYFYGPTVNAARGIADKVNTAVIGFVKNFLTAINPQITKSYAAGDNKYMFSLVFRGARFSFFMMYILSLPILVNTHYILDLWLKNVPEHTILFVQLTLVFALSETLSYPLVTAMLATGDIKKYQIIVGGIEMLNFPVSLLLLYFGFIPEVVMIVALLCSQVCLCARLLLLKGMIGLDIMDFVKNVYLRCLLVCVISVVLPCLLVAKLEESFRNFIILSSICILTSSISIWFLGCSSSERSMVIKFAISRIKRL